MLAENFSMDNNEVATRAFALFVKKYYKTWPSFNLPKYIISVKNNYGDRFKDIFSEEYTESERLRDFKLERPKSNGPEDYMPDDEIAIRSYYLFRKKYINDQHIFQHPSWFVQSRQNFTFADSKKMRKEELK